MSVLDMLRQAQGGSGLGQIAERFGMDPPSTMFWNG
ncbi:MAG: helix-turn-helix domain-containing protein [Pseudomonadota bacterium]